MTKKSLVSTKCFILSTICTLFHLFLVHYTQDMHRNTHTHFHAKCHWQLFSLGKRL